MSLEKEKGVSGEEEKGKETYFLKWTFFCFFFFFFWGGGGVWASGSSLWASDLRYSLAHCLVSKKVSVEHWVDYELFKYLCNIMS